MMHELSSDEKITPSLPDDEDEPANSEYYEGWNNHETVDDRMP